MATEVSAPFRRAAGWLDRASVEEIDMPLNPAACAICEVFAMLTFLYFRSVRGIFFPVTFRAPRGTPKLTIHSKTFLARLCEQAERYDGTSLRNRRPFEWLY